jgi:hypothetical protein
MSRHDACSSHATEVGRGPDQVAAGVGGAMSGDVMVKGMTTAGDGGATTNSAAALAAAMARMTSGAICRPAPSQVRR